MEPLDSKYQEQLDAIAEELLASERLQQYLENEEEEDFQALRDTYEPRIGKIYMEVADHKPAQLIAFEQYLLDPKFEGVFLPKLLGYSVLRGEINDRYKYTRPQDQFKDVILAICNSSNFDYLKKRIGQSIQVAFGLSSDIWITNLINSIDNKRIRYFLQGQKLDKYRDPRQRAVGYQRFANQFKNENFYTAEFPTNLSELKTLYSALRRFIIYRIQHDFDNSSLVIRIKNFLDNEDFQGTREYSEMMGLYAGFFERDAADEKHLKAHFIKAHGRENFSDQFLDYQINTLKSELDLGPKEDQRVSALLDRSQPNVVTDYFDLMDTVHAKGYVHEEAIEAVKTFYNQHSGLSVENECVRYTILSYLRRFISNLNVSEYPEYFKIAQVFPIYMNIFGNQKFNQHLKDLSMAYVRKLLKKYTDKRGKDYQDIKKFVSTTFVDLAFLKEKEVVELFKTRRKKKKPVS